MDARHGFRRTPARGLPVALPARSTAAEGDDGGVDYSDDRRRDTYVALHEWHTRTGEPLDWEQVIFPEEVLRWASADPEVSLLLRHHY